MPNKEFLESYPLYRKFKVNDFPSTTDNIAKVNIKMFCTVCKSSQTFFMSNNYWDGLGYRNTPVYDAALQLKYTCAHCQEFNRYFFVKIDADAKHITKIGQFPGWEITPDKNITKMLGGKIVLFKKGLVCESQGYGIGAFAYYRRIVEEIIDRLLQEISDLMDGSEKNKYLEALEKTKKTIVTQEKISLVKDLLPPLLRPDGMNPLSTLHSFLSEGLHEKPDEDCVELAAAIREVLVYLVNQVAISKNSSKSFTDSMRKLLQKKSK